MATFAFIAIAALRVAVISISRLRSSKSLQIVTFIWSNYYVVVRSLKISPAGRVCTFPYIHFWSGSNADLRAYCQSRFGSSLSLSYILIFKCSVHIYFAIPFCSYHQWQFKDEQRNRCTTNAVKLASSCQPCSLCDVYETLSHTNE